jgi:anti-anti-sigma factor
MQLNVRSDDGDVVVVACEGEVSQIRFQADGNPLGQAVGSGRAGRKVILDMDKAEWMDSSGISWLVVSHKNYNLALCRVPDQVRQTLKFCRMDRIFRLADDEAGARSLLGCQPATPPPA